jgi:Cdc6-like AAA superfamily ATPase
MQSIKMLGRILILKRFEIHYKNMPSFLIKSNSHLSTFVKHIIYEDMFLILSLNETENLNNGILLKRDTLI